jgi:hypothetical protein
MNTVFLRKYYLVLFVVVLITGQTKETVSLLVMGLVH